METKLFVIYFVFLATCWKLNEAQWDPMIPNETPGKTKNTATQETEETKIKEKLQETEKR